MQPRTTKPKADKKGAGGAPLQHDDAQLLAIAAELLAWPEQTNITSQAAALDKALSYIDGSDQWAPSRRSEAMERLRRKFRKAGPELIAKSRIRTTLVMHKERAFDYRGPALPTLLGAPRAPDIALARLRAEKLTDNLREVAALATGLAAAIEKQLGRSENPGLTLLSIDDQALTGMKKMLDRLGKEIGKNSGS
jgi:hypothetical protein